MEAAAIVAVVGLMIVAEVGLMIVAAALLAGVTEALFSVGPASLAVEVEHKPFVAVALVAEPEVAATAVELVAEPTDAEPGSVTAVGSVEVASVVEPDEMASFDAFAVEVVAAVKLGVVATADGFVVIAPFVGPVAELQAVGLVALTQAVGYVAVAQVVGFVAAVQVVGTVAVV